MSVENNGEGVEQRKGRIAVYFTLFVTNMIKIGGLVIAVVEVTKLEPSPLFLALAAFMMAGAQISEETVVKLVGGLFGMHHTPPGSSEK